MSDGLLGRHNRHGRTADLHALRDTFGIHLSKVSRTSSQALRMARYLPSFLNFTFGGPNSDDDTERIQNAITKLQSLLSFPFTARELAPDIS